MRLDPTYLPFITKEQLRLLAAIQLGMRNHHTVPLQVITQIAGLSAGLCYKTICKLHKMKMIYHQGGKHEGYRLTFCGYDYLALSTFIRRGLLSRVMHKIGMGKESDVFMCEGLEGQLMVLKLTRLGRRSFRSVKSNREYIGNRTSYNWLYLSRLSSQREFKFMELLHSQGFPTPKPIDTNRHCILMSVAPGSPLRCVNSIPDVMLGPLFFKCLELAKMFPAYGLLHGDFNEFNLMISQDGQTITVIDFPQCISVKHPNAEDYWRRDVEGVKGYFAKMQRKFGKNSQQNPTNSTTCDDSRLNDSVARSQLIGVTNIIYPNVFPPPAMALDTSDTPMSNDISSSAVQPLPPIEDYPIPLLQSIPIQKRLDLVLKEKAHITLEQEKQLEQYYGQAMEMEFQGEQGHDQNADDEDNAQQQGNEDNSNQQEQGQDSQSGEQSTNVNKDSQQQLKAILQRDLACIEPIGNGQSAAEDSQEQQSDGEEEDGQQQLIDCMTNNPSNYNPKDPNSTAPTHPTPYQQRQILKEQKKEARMSRKAAMTQGQYIHDAVKREKNKRSHQNRRGHAKGNHGQRRMGSKVDTYGQNYV